MTSEFTCNNIFEEADISNSSVGSAPDRWKHRAMFKFKASQLQLLSYKYPWEWNESVISFAWFK